MVLALTRGLKEWRLTGFHLGGRPPTNKTMVFDLPHGQPRPGFAFKSDRRGLWFDSDAQGAHQIGLGQDADQSPVVIDDGQVVVASL